MLFLSCKIDKMGCKIEKKGKKRVFFLFFGKCRQRPLLLLPCWIILFVQPEDVVFRLKLYEIGCMMRNFIPDVLGKVHIWHLDTMQCGTDGPKNTLNGHVRIGMKFFSQMSVVYAFNQTIVGDVFGGIWSDWTF